MRPNREHSLPVVLSVEEVQRILRVEDGWVPIRAQRLLTRHPPLHHRSPSSAARPVARPCARGRSLILKEVNRREQRCCTQTGSPPRGRGHRFTAPALAPAWWPKSGLRQIVTPAGESPGLARDSLQSRSPRAGWRFTCAEGLPLAQSAARSPKRGLALLPKWEYNLVADQYERLSSTRIMRRLRAA